MFASGLSPARVPELPPRFPPVLPGSVLPPRTVDIGFVELPDAIPTSQHRYAGGRGRGRFFLYDRFDNSEAEREK